MSDLVGLQGFKKCPGGMSPIGRVRFAVCEGECPSPCHPLPLMASLLESREVVPDVYSVTEIIKPYQIIYLARHNPFWVEPESQIYMIAGSAAHSIIEEGGKRLSHQDKHLTEVRGETLIETVHGIAHIRGTYDYYDVDRKVLWDFKNSKVYPAKKLLKAAAEGDAHWLDEDYFKQLNIYRALFRPEATKLMLEIMVQGWTTRDGIKKIEQVEVPMAPQFAVFGWVVDRLTQILGQERGVLPIPECSKEETWDGRRCKEYCVCSDFCPQYKGGL